MRTARRVQARPVRVDSVRDGAAPNRLHPGCRRSRRFRRDVDDDRGGARRTSWVACPRRSRVRSIARSSGTGTSSSRVATARSRGRATRRTSFAPSGRWCGWANATARTSCSTGSSRISGPPRGISGPKSSGAIQRRRSSSATCRTPGSDPTTSARCSTCSRTSARPTRHLVIGAGIPEAWVMEKPGVTVRRLSTHYGPLSYTVRNESGRARVSMSTGLTIPPGGIVVHSPFAKPVSEVRVNGALECCGAIGRRARAVAPGGSGVSPVNGVRGVRRRCGASFLGRDDLADEAETAEIRSLHLHARCVRADPVKQYPAADPPHLFDRVVPRKKA